MKLKNRNIAPVGGWFYTWQDDKGNPYRVNGYGGGFNELLQKVRSVMNANHQVIPGELNQLVEDQICSRQPKDRCWKQSGDRLAQAIHVVVSTVDGVAAKLGAKTQLAKKAETCGSCARRRARMNRSLG